MTVVLPDRDALALTMGRHTRPTPRYTSYPTVPFWKPGFSEVDYVEALHATAEHTDREVAVYVHLPFCAKRCYYCGCNALAAHRPEAVDRYLDHVEAEIDGVVWHLGKGRRLTQLHWGGGTPNFLSNAQTERLFRMLRRAFEFAPEAEVSIEMDPRIAREDHVHLLRRLGFNRLSMGVQDFDPKVQAAIGRIQPEEDTVSLLGWARDAGFDSVNFDLVYGLPYQTPTTFRRTLDRVVELGPDRIATFSYAHLPEVRRIQQAVDASGLPDPETKLNLFLDTVEVLGAAGYEWIGLDHFALESDELTLAARERRLQRSFMGYTTRAAPDLLAFGMSAIGMVDGTFVQNHSDLGRYESTIDDSHFPVVRGHRLTPEDHLHGLIIEHLMCNLELPETLTLPGYGATVSELVPEALEGLAGMEAEGFLARNDHGWDVTPMGRFFVRNVAACLDPYLRSATRLPTFSSSV
jgi:oxygen-independent coproporphyrinogen-3 oxidase